MNNNSNNDEDHDEEKRHHRPWGNWQRPGMEHLGRSRFGQRGFLRPQIVQLLEKEPMNGVDIMNELQEMSHGWYRPSPGSIYPLLEQLEKEGLIARNEGGKFELTAAFAEQAGTGGDLASAISAMESNASYLEDLQKADGAKLSKQRDRIEKLAKRLEALSGALRSGSEPQ
ncbi:MAG: PadR family transcriptional regulator [Nitrososphaerales archaeon]